MERMVLVRLRTNLLTSSESSPFRSCASASCLSVASGSRPSRMGFSNFL